MKTAGRLLSFCAPYRLWLLAAFGLIMFTSLTINFLPVLIQRMTDQCLVDTTAPLERRIVLLTQLGLGYILIAALGHSMRYAQAMLTAWSGQKIIYDLRMAVFGKVLRMHQAYFDRTAVGVLMTRVTSDIERLQHFVTEGVVGSLADIFMLLGIMGYMIWFSPVLSLAIFAALPILFALMYFINVRLRNANRDIRDRQSRLNALIQEDLTGMTTIQLFNREKSAIEAFDKRNTHLRTACFDEVRWFSLYFPVIEGSQILAILLTLGVGSLAIMQGTEVITVGKLIAFLAYVRNFFHPLGSLSDKAGSFQVAIASIERVFTLLDTREEVREPKESVLPARLAGSIAFNKVSFAYVKKNWVIKNLSFEVKPGKTLAIVGATGAGKSTIVNLIGRFYDVQKGTVTIGGVDVRRFAKHDLRSRLGYVFQEPFIFTGSVAENISLGIPGLKRAAVECAAKTVNAHQFIKMLPNGYDTILNERGAGLSLGQKQLLAMARILVRDPKLLFVLDEATASVDTATEKLIQDALVKLAANRTSIMIAHRLSTIRHADCILIMRQGELVGQGTHKELMQENKYYQQLYELLLHDPDTW